MFIVIIGIGVMSSHLTYIKEKGDGSIFHFKEDFNLFFSLFKMDRSKA